MRTREDSQGLGLKTVEKTRLLERSYDILLAINNHPEGLTLREVCNYTRLPRSTVQRILATLEQQNIVIMATQAGLYRLGPTLTLFAENVRPFDIAQIARPALMSIASRTEESVYLCVLAHGKAVVVDLIRGSHPLRTLTTMGTSLPLHATACGKALLAALPEPELDPFRHLGLPRMTARTVTDWVELEAELERIRDTGVALDREEHQKGTSGIAVALRGPSGEIGAVSIPMPTERFREIEEQLTGVLVSEMPALRWTR